MKRHSLHIYKYIWPKMKKKEMKSIHASAQHTIEEFKDQRR